MVLVTRTRVFLDMVMGWGAMEILQDSILHKVTHLKVTPLNRVIPLRATLQQAIPLNLVHTHRLGILAHLLLTNQGMEEWEQCLQVVPPLLLQLLVATKYLMVPMVPRPEAMVFLMPEAMVFLMPGAMVLVMPEAMVLVMPEAMVGSSSTGRVESSSTESMGSMESMEEASLRSGSNTHTPAFQTNRPVIWSL